MKTFEKLCRRFERLNPGYTADFDTINSYPGFYCVYIESANDRLGTTYTFPSCASFRDWMDGVVLD